MNKQERFQGAFTWLMNRGAIKNQTEAARKIGTTQQNVSSALRGNPKVLTDRFLRRFNAAFDGVFDIEWLISGEGEMLACSEQTASPHEANRVSARSGQAAGLPLVPFDALAGLPGGDIPGIRLEDCERYVVPELSRAGAQFLVRVAGASMQPRYLSGDLLAVRRLSSATFLQWGKVYVLDTEQGLLVKKLMPCEGNDECVMCVSENEKEFPPFLLPKADIRSLSIVVGHVSVE